MTTTETDAPARVAPATSRALSAEAIADFVDHEAELADTHRFDEWLALWSPVHAAYFVPHGAKPESWREVAIIRDDYTRLNERIRRLQSGYAYAQNPPSVLNRVIGRLRIEPAEDGAVRVTGKFVCVEVRPGQRETLWSGKVIYTLAERADGGIEMRRKEVRLVNSHTEIPTLSFLI
jgi:3-phenylpropionate/cinnamic acid dioxygenase small subunit